MSEQIINRNWRDRLGGSYAVSVRAFMITSLLALIYMFQVQNIASLTSAEILKWLAIYSVAILTVGILNLALERILFSERSEIPVSPIIALANHGLHGLLFALALYDGSKILGLNYSGNVIYQVSVTVLLSLWWGPMMAIFLDHRAENSEQRNVLVERAVATEALSIRQLQSREILDEILHGEVAAELALAESELRREAGKDDHVAVSEILKRTAIQKVRPISHEMAKFAAINYPRIRWWRMPLNIVRNQPINVIMIIAIALVGGGAQQIELLGIAHALQIMIALYIFIAVFGYSANHLMTKYPKRHTHIFISTSLLLQLSIPINVHYREIWSPGNSSLGWQVQQLVSGLILILTTAGFGAWSSINNRLNANFKEDIDHRRIEAIATSRQIADQTREASRLLHGKVQTKLVACAMAIDMATITGDESKINEAVLQALIVLKSPLVEQGFGSNLSEEIHRKANLWSEICAISITMDPLITSSNPSLIIQVGRIIEEAISNAIRHGKAKSISINLTKSSGSEIDISISDDGLGPQGGNPSLGSALLAQASGGRWSLLDTGHGSELKVSIAGR